MAKPVQEVLQHSSDVRKLARAIGKDMAYVSRITRLMLLSPEIIHGVLTGQLDQIGVEKCKQPFPILWDEQKKFFWNNFIINQTSTQAHIVMCLDALGKN